jgi:hypothetical protein
MSAEFEEIQLNLLLKPEIKSITLLLSGIKGSAIVLNERDITVKNQYGVVHCTLGILSLDVTSIKFPSMPKECDEFCWRLS